MHVTGLRIAGFKSFVDPVEVPIEEGLTGIVGPNGCGKSNLLEALRWVMGATSARAMRGGEMDDLIFAGTTERPAREIAEVSLILDNSARTAPSEFNDEDVIEVRRTLRRGAGSSYRINGRTVRARDVQILFADASTGANSPALVRQGQISELINSKPENRRRILEEAAGIGGLAARRHEAELKLKAAETNLERLNEVMAEIERQANSLKRQAGKARRYRALSDEIAAVEARLGAARWRGAVTEHAQAATDIAHIQSEIERTVAAVARTATDELNARSAIDPLRAAETEAAGQAGALKLQQARLESERDAARETLRRLEADTARLNEEETRIGAELEDARKRAELTRNDLSALPPENPQEEAAHIAALNERVDTVRRALAETETEADTLRTKLARAEANAAAARHAVASETRRIERLDAEIARATSDLRALGDLDALTERLAIARAESEETGRRAHAAQEALAAATRNVEAARKEEERLTPPLHTAERRVRELEAELAGLDRLIRESADTAPAVIDRMDTHGLERALAAALGADLEASEDSSASAYWSGRSAEAAAPLPEGAEPLSAIAHSPAALHAVLSQIGLVDRNDGDRLQAYLRVGQALVSREGDLWRWDGFVRRNDAPLPAAEHFAHRARRAGAMDELKRAQADLQAAADARQAASAALTGAELTLIGLRRRTPDFSREATRTREAELRAEQDVERLKLRRAALESALERLTPEREAAAAAIEEARAQEAQAPTDTDREAVTAINARLAALRQDERAATAELDAFTRERERAAAVRHKLAADNAEWTRRGDTAAARLETVAGQLEAARKMLAEAADAPERLQKRLDALADQVSAAEDARRQAADRFAVAETALRQAEFASRQARDSSAATRESLARAEARLEAAARREAEIAETVRAAFDRDLEDLEALVASIAPENDSSGGDPEPAPPASAGDPAALDARLAQLRRDRDNLGAVNMEADEQLAEISGRMGLQMEEHADLVAAIAKLREGVEALNEEGRARLLEAYEAVNEHFKSLFTALFAGGEAELRLTNAPDPLDAGLEIYASPPGKRLGALTLMSGGEQALTATALIFAVFLSRPAPICVLDEVDAPLDDANVDRFCRLLDEMRKRTHTRFTVITHNAVSMSRMDRLFGVTMQERGVSRLVSVDLEAAERLAAA
ncbi:MAG: AAA family ATPase [Hyphomonadaceae bacterium]